MENKFPIEPATPIDTTEQNVPASIDITGPAQETVKRPFTETSLENALILTDKKGELKIQTPNSLEPLADVEREEDEYLAAKSAEATSPAPEKKKRNKLLLAIGGVASLLVVGAVAMGLNNNNADNGPKDGPVAEAPVNPGEEPANPVDPEVTPEEPEAEAPAGFEVAGLPSLAELEINPGQSDEQVAQSLVKLNSDWSMAGANKEMYDLQYAPDNEYLSLEDYVTKITDATDPIYVQAIYGDNATNPLFADAIALQKEQHRQVLMAHFQTYGNQNTAPYYQKENFSQLQEAVKKEDGTTTMFVTMIREDNGADNIVEGSGNGSITRATYITGEVNGKIKLVQPAAYVLQ